MEAKFVITICMGSSCFSRGNNKIIGIINEYVSAHNLTKYCEIKGSLCAGSCNTGPNININDTKYSNITENAITEILDFHFNQLKGSTSE